MKGVVRSVASVAWLLAGSAITAAVVPREGALLEEREWEYSREIHAPGEGLVRIELDLTAVAHARPPVDLRVVTEEGRQVPFLANLADEPLRVGLGAPRPVGGGDGRSRYAIDLPFERIPGATLEIGTDETVFRRSVRLLGTDERGGSVVLGRAEWVHEPAAPAAPVLRFPLPARPGSGVVLEIDERDNEPLALRDPVLVVPTWELRFHQPAGRRLRLLYGNPDARGPEYDLALLGEQVRLQKAERGALGPERRSEGRRPRETWGFWVAIVASLVALLVMAVRLLLRGAEAE